MSKGIQRTLDTLGLSPWQALAVIAAGAFYVGDMRPKLAAGEKLTISVDKLTETVATLTTKVEVHAVLLANVEDQVRTARAEGPGGQTPAKNRQHPLIPQNPNETHPKPTAKP